MNQKLEKVKTHLKENKKVYIAAGVGVAVGAAASVLIHKSSSILNARQVQVLTWKSQQTIEVFVEALGDPGNIIQDTTTGIVYASQGQAARELGLNPSLISQHLRGKFPDVKGHSFIKLGKAMVSDEVA